LAVSRTTGASLRRQVHESYDAETDTLFIRLNDKPTTAKHLDEEIWLLVDPETQEPYGFFVEDLQRVFLKRHPELQVAWSKAHPPVTRRVSQAVQDAFVRVLLGWLVQNNKELTPTLSPSA
jgi:hypothetical protein